MNDRYEMMLQFGQPIPCKVSFGIEHSTYMWFQWVAAYILSEVECVILFELIHVGHDWKEHVAGCIIHICAHVKFVSFLHKTSSHTRPYAEENLNKVVVSQSRGQANAYFRIVVVCEFCVHVD